MRATAFLVTVFASLCLAHPFADAPGDECPPMVVSTTALWVLWKTVSGVVVNMCITTKACARVAGCTYWKDGCLYCKSTCQVRSS